MIETIITNLLKKQVPYEPLEAEKTIMLMLNSWKPYSAETAVYLKTILDPDEVDALIFIKSAEKEIQTAEEIILKDNSSAYKAHYESALSAFNQAKEKMPKVKILSMIKQKYSEVATKLDRFIDLNNTQKLLDAASLSSTIEDFRLNPTGTLEELIKRLKAMELYEDKLAKEAMLQEKYNALEKDYEVLKGINEKLEAEKILLGKSLDEYKENLVACQEQPQIMQDEL